MGTLPGKEGIVEPKKSARLAEKRKLREEAGPPATEEDYYFTPLTRLNRSSPTSGSRQFSISPSPIKERLSPRSQIKAPIPISGTHVPSKALSSSSSQSTTSNLVAALPDTSKGCHVLLQTPTVRLTQIDKKKLELPTESQPTSESLEESIEENKSDPIVKKILYINRPDMITVSFPSGMEIPLSKASTRSNPPLPPKYCSMPGCKNLKKYICSRTKAPICSLACYNKNLANSTTVPTVNPHASPANQHLVSNTNF